jgi:hypothetical protein
VVGWLLTGWPKIPFTNFPPKIEEAKAAFTGVTARGSAVSSSNSASVGASPDANIAVNKIVIVQCVSDNNDTSNAATTFHTVTDTDLNSWTRVYEETDSDGAANDGSTTSLWWTKVTTQIDTTDTITCTLGASKTDKVMSFLK